MDRSSIMKKTLTTLDRLRRRHEAEGDRVILVAPVGGYSLSASEDFYFRALYAAISLGWTRPKVG